MKIKKIDRIELWLIAAELFVLGVIWFFILNIQKLLSMGIQPCGCEPATSILTNPYLKPMLWTTIPFLLIVIIQHLFFLKRRQK